MELEDGYGIRIARGRGRADQDGRPGGRLRPLARFRATRVLTAPEKKLLALFDKLPESLAQPGVLALVLGRGPLAVLRAPRLPRRQRAEHRGLARAVPALRALDRGPADEDPRAGGEPALVRRGRAGAGRARARARGRAAGLRAPGRAARGVGQRAGGGGRGRDRRVLSGVRVRARRRRRSRRRSSRRSRTRSRTCTDFKSELQERLAQRGEFVAYRVVSEEGPPHERLFETVAEVDGTLVGRGSGRSKKESEQEAAREALEQLERGRGAHEDARRCTRCT